MTTPETPQGGASEPLTVEQGATVIRGAYMSEAIGQNAADIQVWLEAILTCVVQGERERALEEAAKEAESYCSPATWAHAEDQPYTLGREIAAAIRALTATEDRHD